MGRNYIRKTSRQSWSVSSLQAAVRAVKLGLSQSTAARIYCIPKKTLMRYVAKQEEVPVVAPLGTFKTILSRKQEEKIVNQVILMSQSAIGMNHLEIRKMAYQMAEKHSVAHPWQNKLAGKDWLRSFLQRHPELALRKAENTSLARLTGFNRESVHTFFELLSGTMAENQYSPQQIWNADETGFSNVQSRATRVFAKKGQRQVASASSAERGTNTTVILAMSASGEYVPPAFIFPRSRLSESLKSGAPENSLFLCNPSGWSTVETCSAWFDHFLQYARPTASRPILLILDGHASHTKNIDMLEKASANSVRILSIPPHTSHKLQPLDVSVMGPVKLKYTDAMHQFLKSNPGRAVTVYEVASLVNKALAEAETTSNALSGFRATGICPLNSSIFTDSDFETADFLERTTKSNGQLQDKSTEKSLNVRNDINHGSCLSMIGIADNPVYAINEDTVIDNITHTTDIQNSISATADSIQGPELNAIPSIKAVLTEKQTTEENDISTSGNQLEIDSVVDPILATMGDNTIMKHCLLVDEMLGGCDMVDSTIPAIGEQSNLVTAETAFEGFFIDEDEMVIIDPNVYYVIAESGEINIEYQPKQMMCNDQEITNAPDDYAFIPPSTLVEAEDTQSSMNYLEHGEVPTDHDVKYTSLAATTIIQPKTNERDFKQQSTKRKGRAEDLTSTPYRKKLREANAQRAIKDIVKKGRKKDELKGCKKKNILEDSLCATCGESFSSTCNGDGWSCCSFCHAWFHCKCNDDDPLLCKSCY